MNTIQVQDMVAEVAAVMHGIPEDERLINDQRYDAEQIGLNLFESVLTNSKHWKVNGMGVTMEHPAGVRLDLDVMGSMLMAVQEDEHHLVISVDGQPICVAGEGIFHDVPMSDHLTTVVLLGEAGFPVSHTPDTLYMLHSPTHLLKVMGGDHLSLKERVSAAKMLVAYVHEEEELASFRTKPSTSQRRGTCRRRWRWNWPTPICCRASCPRLAAAARPWSTNSSTCSFA